MKIIEEAEKGIVTDSEVGHDFKGAVYEVDGYIYGLLQKMDTIEKGDLVWCTYRDTFVDVPQEFIGRHSESCPSLVYKPLCQAPTKKENPGRKDDSEKLRWDLLPYDQLEKVVAVMTVGAKKYGDDNWQEVSKAERRYFAALMRHAVAYKKGELLDPDDGLPHLAHAACCALFLLHFDDKKPTL
jgi:hypothetical protein